MWKVAIVIFVSWYILNQLPDKFSIQFSIQFGQLPKNHELNEPLYLTPLLVSGNISGARELSRVKPDIMDNTPSYSGYFTVNKACESNLFFWFFPAQEDWEEAPVILWVQGGPAASSLTSMFETVGPFMYKDSGGLRRRQYSWNVKNNLLFIDQPVGAGFSYTGRGCYAENITRVGKEFYSAVLQFYHLFPELINNKLFIVGQSYAGHFIPVLGHTIHKKNPLKKLKINLSGMVIGNGLMDTLYQSDYGSLLYQLGLIDESARDFYYKLQDKYHQCLKNQEWDKALTVFSSLIGETFKKYVGNVSIYNYLEKDYNPFKPYTSFLNMPETRKAIHVGNMKFTSLSEIAARSLGVDAVLSVKQVIEELLEHYFLVFYTGQLDIITGYPLVANFLSVLNWSGKESLKTSARKKWCVGEEQAGYVKGAHNLYNVMVRNAGHIATQDQPHWLYILVNSITSGPRDNPLHELQMC